MSTFYALIGPVSEGTMNPLHLIESLSDELKVLTMGAISMSDMDGLTASDMFELIASCDREWKISDATEVDEMVQTLFEAMEQFAPPLCYFGAHPDDGASFGFWPTDVAEYAADNGDELMLIDGGTPDYLASINDHGNVTLYRVTVEEIWSVV